MKDPLKGSNRPRLAVIVGRAAADPTRITAAPWVQRVHAVIINGRESR